MEQEYIQNQEVYKPREKEEESEQAKVEDLRGNPLSVGNLEEIIDDNHCIVSSSMGPEYYVSIMSFVNQDLLETGCQVLLHNKVQAPDILKLPRGHPSLFNRSSSKQQQRPIIFFVCTTCLYVRQVERYCQQCMVVLNRNGDGTF